MRGSFSVDRKNYHHCHRRVDDIGGMGWASFGLWFDILLLKKPWPPTWPNLLTESSPSTPRFSAFDCVSNYADPLVRRILESGSPAPPPLGHFIACSRLESALEWMTRLSWGYGRIEYLDPSSEQAFVPPEATNTFTVFHNKCESGHRSSSQSAFADKVSWKSGSVFDGVDYRHQCLNT